VEAITRATLEMFLQRLGERSSCVGALYLLGERVIEFGQLESLFEAIRPGVVKADILPGEFRHHFEELRRRVAGAGP